MEKSKRRRVIFKTINFILMVGVFAAMFAISISAGIAALVFSFLGGFFGYNCKTAKVQKAFFDKLLENKEDLLSGKTIVVDASEDTVKVSVKKPKVHKHKEKK